MLNAKCKICRRLGTKLFLKGEKCLSPKCPVLKKAYPPGLRGKRRKKSMTEYGKELREKQKLKNWYNLRERQFRNYVKEVLKKQSRGENMADLLINKLESRLDNVVFSLGFASSRQQARQLVSHGHFLINGRKVNIPSYQVKKGDKIALNPKSRQKNVFRNLAVILKKHNLPSWLKLDLEEMTGEVVGKPSLSEGFSWVEISSIFEFYSR
jgi:small subunit ribosomal protein S4